MMMSFINLLKETVLLDEISVKLIKKMQEDFNNISLQDFLSFNYDNKKGGWKALHYFMEKGITKSLREGFELYLNITAL